MNRSSSPRSTPIPAEGSLALLATGWRGLDAWRAARGDAWLDTRKAQFLAAKALEDEASAPEATSASPEDATRQASGALDGVHIVVVSGLPRSGTSMLMQMLDAAGLTPFTDRERSPDASNPKGYYEHDAVRSLARDHSWIGDADGHVLKVVSPLLPYLPVGPRYDVILIERDLDEVLRSQSTMLERSGMDAAGAERLRPIYAKQAAVAAAWTNEMDGARALRLSHREVIADPQEAAAQIASFLGSGLDVRAMASVVDGSLYRERASGETTE